MKKFSVDFLIVLRHSGVERKEHSTWQFADMKGAEEKKANVLATVQRGRLGEPNRWITLGGTNYFPGDISALRITITEVA